MKCIYCGCDNTRVNDSRKSYKSESNHTNYIHRRRYCYECGKTFTSIEIPYKEIEDVFKIIDGSSVLAKALIFGENFSMVMSKYKTPNEKDAGNNEIPHEKCTDDSNSIESDISENTSEIKKENVDG